MIMDQRQGKGQAQQAYGYGNYGGSAGNGGNGAGGFGGFGMGGFGGNPFGGEFWGFGGQGQNPYGSDYKPHEETKDEKVLLKKLQKSFSAISITVRLYRTMKRSEAAAARKSSRFRENTVPI